MFVYREAGYDVTFRVLGNIDGFVSWKPNTIPIICLKRQKFEGDIGATLDGVIALIEAWLTLTPRQKLENQVFYLINNILYKGRHNDLSLTYFPLEKSDPQITFCPN